MVVPAGAPSLGNPSIGRGRLGGTQLRQEHTHDYTTGPHLPRTQFALSKTVFDQGPSILPLAELTRPPGLNNCF